MAFYRLVLCYVRIDDVDEYVTVVVWDKNKPVIVSKYEIVFLFSFISPRHFPEKYRPQYRK